ncbi:MAG: hypothetical protein H7234_07110 [Herminiimonas sp.]|nr:hypothetical protein [Herminiimonas sp.]
MATDTRISAFAEPNGSPIQPELLISSVLHLMSHYSANLDDTLPCTKLASVIERHLHALAVLPELTPVLRTTCQQLSEQWAAVVEKTILRSEKSPLRVWFSRKSLPG